MRIEPTHFIEVFGWGGIVFNNDLLPISQYHRYVGMSSGCPTVAIFLIREKTPNPNK